MPAASKSNVDHVQAPKNSGEPGDLHIGTAFGGDERSIWHALSKMVSWARRITAALRSTMREVTAIRARMVSWGFGEMYVEDETVWQAGLGAAFVKLTQGWDGGVTHGGVTFDAANSQMVVRDDGHYHITLNLSGEGGNNSTYQFAIFKNGVKTHAVFDRSFGSTATVGAGSCAAIVEVQSRDVFDVRIRVVSGAATTFLASQAMLCLVHIADYGNVATH